MDAYVPPRVVDEAEIAARKKFRAIIACDLLLARLFKYHPQHAIAALKGVEPNVIDLEPPAAPAPVAQIIPLPVEAIDELLGKQPTVVDILREVSEFYRISPLDVCSQRRHYRSTRARQITMYLARELTLNTFETIGRTLGKRDPTTCIHGHRRIEQAAAADERLADEIAVLKLRIADKFLNKAA